MVLLPGVVICNEYFNKLKAVAIAIASCGTGVSCLVLPLGIGVLIDFYGWRVSIMCVSALCLQSCVLSCLMYPAEFWKPQCISSQEGNELCVISSPSGIDISSQMKSNCRYQWINHYFKNVTFYLFSFNHYLWSCTCLILLVLLVDFASSQGISREYGAMLISMVGLCSLLGRLGSGILAYMLNIQHLTLFTASTALTSFAVTMLPIFSGFIPLACLSALYGIGYGCQTFNLVMTIIELFGAEHLATSFGLLSIWSALGTLTGPPLGGLLYQIEYSYDLPLFFAGSLSAVAVVIQCVIRLLKKKKSIISA